MNEIKIIEELNKIIEYYKHLNNELETSNLELKSQLETKSSYDISKFDITLQQLELLFDFLPGVKYFASEYQLLHDVYPSEFECEIYKDMKNKIYSLILNLSIE